MLTHDDLSKIAELIIYFGFLAVVFCCGAAYIIPRIGQVWNGVFENFLACFPKRVVIFFDRRPFVHKVLVLTFGIFVSSLFCLALCLVAFITFKAILYLLI